MNDILKLIVFFILLSYPNLNQAQEISQWRGKNRDGVYLEKELLKTWPESGPKLLWKYEGLGNGFGSLVVTSDKLFVNGVVDSMSYLFAIDLNGKELWKSPNGKEFFGTGYSSNFPGSKSTPTLFGHYVYVCSGNGMIACFDKQTGNKKWDIDMKTDFDGILNLHGFVESLMVDDDNVYCLPGGPNSNVIALNRTTGKTVWVSKAMGDTASYCSPVIIKLPQRNILVTFSGHYLMGLDAKTGELLWSHEQKYHFYHQQCNTPIYSDGNIYYIAGEGNGAVKLELSPDGKNIKQVWENYRIKNVFSGFVKINDHLFTPDPSQKMMCLDAKTGIVIDSLRIPKGELILADDMLYCYSDNGVMNLIKITGTKMEITGKFKVREGSKEHFAHPVISNGVLYIRHGNALIAYDIKQL